MLPEKLSTPGLIAGVFLMEAVWPRFLPAYVRMKEEVERGAIGKVWQVSGFNL